MSIFSKIFNSGKKDFTYNGPRPPASLLSVTGGQPYYDTITSRLAGRGVGFGDTYANDYANPIVANMRNNFESNVIPELNSELSKTGRRAGSSGFSQVAKARGNEAYQEGDVFSRLQQRNEDQKRQEINDAFGKLGDFNKNEYNTNANAANFEYDKIYAPQVQREQTRTANEAAGYQKLGDAAVTLATGHGVPNLGGNPTGQYLDYGDARYPITTPPYGYNYNYQQPQQNVISRLASRIGQLGRVA